MPSTPVLQKFVESVEDLEGLDAVASALRGLAETVTGSDAERRLLTGEAIGTPLHPALVHLPLGAAISALVVDLMGEEHDRVAGWLTGLVVASAVPTSAAGLADYATKFGSRARRLGAAHMVLMATGTTLTAASWLGRTLGGRASARVLLVAALAAYGTGGMLGGHLVHDVEDTAPTA